MQGRLLLLLLILGASYQPRQRSPPGFTPGLARKRASLVAGRRTARPAGGSVLADISAEWCRDAPRGRVEDLKIFADASMAAGGDMTLGGKFPVYKRPADGTTLSKQMTALAPEARRANPARRVLGMAAMAAPGNPAVDHVLASVKLITHRRALRQLLRMVARDTEFTGPPWQKRYRDREYKKDSDLVAEWVTLPGGRRCLALTGTYSSRQEEFRSYGADFERKATLRDSLEPIKHYRLVSYNLSGVPVMLSAETDSVTADGKGVELKTMRQDYFGPEFESKRMVDLYFQMLLGGSEVLALGLLDFARLAEVQEFTLGELEARLPDVQCPSEVMLGRISALLQETERICDAHDGSGPFVISFLGEGDRMEIRGSGGDC